MRGIASARELTAASEPVVPSPGSIRQSLLSSHSNSPHLLLHRIPVSPWPSVVLEYTQVHIPFGTWPSISGHVLCGMADRTASAVMFGRQVENVGDSYPRRAGVLGCLVRLGTWYTMPAPVMQFHPYYLAISSVPRVILVGPFGMDSKPS